MSDESRYQGPRGLLHFPSWTKDCWRGRSPGMCWLCHLRLVGFGVRSRLRDMIAPVICRARGHRYEIDTRGLLSAEIRCARCGDGVTLTRRGELELSDGTRIEVSD